MALQSTRKLVFDLRHTIAAQPILSGFAALGGLFASYATYLAANFFSTHFLRPNRLRTYLSNDYPTWAVVTGATDGIGRGFAEELLAHGFNVVLHGRNDDKLKRVKDELLAQWPSREIDVIRLDAMVEVDVPGQLEDILQVLRNRKPKILINNVAGELHPLFLAHAQGELHRDKMLTNGNFMFAIEFTRLLLPQLIENKPALIMNIGSGSAKLPCPYIAVAAASKTFLQSFSHALAVEMVAEGHPEVEIMYNLVGMCSTGSEPRPVTFLVPDSRYFAKSSLGLVGHGYRSVWGYWPHALQFETLFMLPRVVVERLCIGLARDLRRQYQEKEQAAKID